MIYLTIHKAKNCQAKDPSLISPKGEKPVRWMGKSLPDGAK